MLPIIPKPAISVRQKVAALWVAGVVDFIQMPGFMIFGEGFLSVFQDGLDFLTAIILIAICGFRWQFILAFAMELVPGLSLFPTWTMVVLTMPTDLAEQSDDPAYAQRIRVERVDAEFDPDDSEPNPPSNEAEVTEDGVVVPPVQAPRVASRP